MNTERVMARVVTIDNVEKHPNADALDICTVGGWNIITKIGEYKTGDLAVMCEIDSWVPHELAPFLSKGKEPREYKGVKGERLKTAKLRGVVSQGLLLPFTETLADYAKDYDSDGQPFWMGPEDFFNVGGDVSEVLGIVKWEPEIPAQLAGQVRGNFPSQIPKTNQERVQNIKKEISIARDQGLQFVIEEKLEGSSLTMYLDIEDEFHVCSRNLDLKNDGANSFWRAAIKYDVENVMRQNNLRSYAIQAELLGPGIQGNIYKLPDVEFYVFDVYSVKQSRYLYPVERRELIANLGLNQVPVVCESTTLGTMEEIISLADGKSMLYNTLREGIVFKQLDGDMTFKSISAQYLIKTGN